MKGACYHCLKTNSKKQLILAGSILHRTKWCPDIESVSSLISKYFQIMSKYFFNLSFSPGNTSSVRGKKKIYRSEIFQTNSIHCM